MKNLEQLFQQVANAQEGLDETAHRRMAVRRRLETFGRQPSPLRVPARKAFAWGMGVAVTLALVVALGTGRKPRVLTATVGSTFETVSNGSWVDAPETSSLPLRFSDGTKIEVAPHAKLRVVELGQRGARLALEHGKAGVAVAHGEDRQWELRAGPFVVHVTGTRFFVSWIPSEDQFELTLNEGQVEIEGCGFGEGRKLVAGQTVSASCRDGSVSIAYSGALSNGSNRAAVTVAPSAFATVESVKPTQVPSPSKVVAPVAPSATPTVPTGSDWRQLARAGRYAEALLEANRRGFDAECASAEVQALSLLGEAAQRAHEPVKARQAWLALRKRFAGSPQAAVATFSLGVVEFDQWHANAKAVGWFRTYIRENPNGPLLREARGRLLEALQASEGDEVRTLARDYLLDYPSGPHAALARRLAPSP